MVIVVDVAGAKLVSREVERGAAVSAAKSHAVAGGVVGMAEQQPEVQVGSGGVRKPVSYLLLEKGPQRKSWVAVGRKCLTGSSGASSGIG
jgi:hypothetical protein